MAKYRVEVPYLIWVTKEVEADSEESAIDIVIDNANIGYLVGNNGTDKIIGIQDGSIEFGCEPFEKGDISMYANEV